uniref:Activin types I and II receptor domain-containing protein n=1 Tax=Parascaris univalens TaxID=6257 RepID=A0A914ZUQ7_PARUN
GMNLLLVFLWLGRLAFVSPRAEQLAQDVEQWARLLGEHIQETFNDATKQSDITAMYKNYAEAEIFDPRMELKKAKNVIEAYLRRRAKAAWDAKLSLESRMIANLSEEEVNDPMSMNFIRFMSAKGESDAARVYAHNHHGLVTEVNATRTFNLTPNANFYGIATSSIASAVHIPTPVYERNAEVLLKIDWSDIDQLYRANREQTRDLAFQMFCSESGFMRYFPAASWIWDNKDDQLDLYDCRSTEWFINGATLSKNVIIMLDLSGSMLGQRFEIAKQTVEAILETLSDNDFFNIMPFSKVAAFLDECAEQAGLLQATVRNKKLLRARLNGIVSEGKAEYEKGLSKAFETLMKMRNYTSKREQLGCSDVIMLITDGAPSYFKEIFQLYNEKKTVRFFSFLIGEEAIDFEQVKWMACSNKGFMVHISNMADVQEKVQHYIKVMSRPLGKHASMIREEDAVWSGVYRERLMTTGQVSSKKKLRVKRLDAKSEMFVTTVSYPVTVDGTLMGVSAVDVPVTELIQLAHSSSLGSRSYTFMMDNNGYVMFHPQLRPIDPVTKQTKPNYNNVDILELEVPQNQQLMRSSMINCDNIDAHKLDILFATEDVQRVYRQTNTYYAECIQDALFTVGMAVASGDEKRIRPRKPIDYGSVEMSWFEGPNWRMHPQWRYCLVNDTDALSTPEESFAVYVKQMRVTGKLPKLCEPRRALVDRFLFDMKVTNGLTNSWDVSWKKNRRNQIHLVFFSTPSGMIKFWNELPNGLSNTDPNWIESVTTPVPKSTPQSIPTQQSSSYSHYVLDENRRSSEDRYFRRAVRMRNHIVVDVNLKTKLWYSSEAASAYGNPENVSLLMTASKALYVDGALIGVAGMEFTVDSFAKTLSKMGCGPQDDRRWCLLLDEHAYVVYSSLKNTRYGNVFSTNSDERKGNLLGRWFGTINRITERTMSLLLKNNFYTENTYVDYQATCKQQPLTVVTAGAFKPAASIINSLLWIVSRIWRALREFGIVHVVDTLLSPVYAYTATFHDGSEGYPCDKASNFYLANWGEEGWMGQRTPATAALIADNLSERPCRHNTAKCAVKTYASWVPGSNLLLVVIAQTTSASSACYDETQCPLSSPSEFRFGFTQVDNASDKQQVMSMEPSDPFAENIFERKCRHVRAKQRKAPSKCIRADDDESHLPCSKAVHCCQRIDGSTLVLLGAVIVLAALSR